MIDRRTMLERLAGVTAGAAFSHVDMQAAADARQPTGGGMYGLIGKMTTTPGSRDALVAILLEGTAAMPGCLQYVVSLDTEDADGIWITEAWQSEADHQASLKLPEVQAAIGKARPLIAGFSNRVVTRPVGGVGLVKV